MDPFIEAAIEDARMGQAEVLQEAACIELMRGFIAAHPALWNEDIGVV